MLELPLLVAKILRSVTLPILCVAMLVGCVQPASFNAAEQHKAKSSTYLNNFQTQKPSMIYKVPQGIEGGVKPPIFPGLPEENPTNGE